MSVSNQQMAEAIYDKVFEDIAPAPKASEEQPQAEMMGRLFRHMMVKKIMEVLEKA